MVAAVQTFDKVVYGTRTNTTVTKPSGTASGDLLLAFVFAFATGSFPTMPSPPAGWQLYWASQRVADAATNGGIGWLFIKTAGGSEPSNYTWTHDTSGPVEITITRVNGQINAANPITVITENKGTGSTSTGLGLTTPENNALVILWGFDWGDTANSLTAPAGSTPTFTKLFSAPTTTLQQLFYGTLATAGATGNKTFTSNNNGTNPWVTCMFVVNSASYAPADFVHRGNVATANSITANQSALTINTPASGTPMVFGDLLVAVCALDNRIAGTTGVDNNEITDIFDVYGNIWTRAKGSSFGGSAQAGAVCTVFYTVVTNPPWLNQSSFVVNFQTTNTATNDASAVTIHKFEVAPGKFPSVDVTAADGTIATAANPPSLNVTTANASRLRIRGIAAQMTAATNITPTASWTAWTVATGSTGTAGTSMGARAEHIINTATSAASDPTGLGTVATATVYVAFKAGALFADGVAESIATSDVYTAVWGAGGVDSETVAVAETMTGIKLNNARITGGFGTMLLADGVNWAGLTLRVRFETSMLAVNSGGDERVSFEFLAGTSGNIAAAYIGHAASSGDPYDFDGSQQQLTFDGGSTTKAVSGATTVVSDYNTSFAYDATKALIISVAFTGTTINLAGY